MAETSPSVNGNKAKDTFSVWILLVEILSRLPLPVLYVIADSVYLLLYDLFRYRRKLILNNLKESFPEKNSRDISKIARRSFRNAIMAVFETIYALRMDKDEILRRVQIINQTLLEDAMSKGHPVIALTAHYCNWEWLLPAVAASLPFPVDGLYKPLRDPALTQLMVHVRSRFGSYPIPTTNASREIIKRRNVPRLLGLVADLAPGDGEDKYWTTFLNRETAFYTGPVKITELMDAPVVFIAMRRLRRGYYEITFEPISSPPYIDTQTQVLEAYIRRLEQQILDTPENWLWAYPRWKYPKPQ